MPGSRGPLAGLRVLEIASLGPGPHAAMQLADLGADVVRIQKPDRIAATRGDASLRGRRQLAMDLRQPANVAVVRELVTHADVLLEGYRPGVMERLGIGPDDCLGRNPRLIYARMTGWGQSGPLSASAGHDINYLSLTGVLHAMGRAGDPPMPPLNLVGDFGGGSMLLLVGVLAALFERGRSGQGQVIDAAMVDGVGLLSHLIWAFRARGRWSDEREANLLDGGAPFYNTYACADGRYVAVGAVEPQFYANLLAVLDLAAADLPAQWDTTGWPGLRRRFAEVFAGRGRDEWVRLADGRDACLSPVLSFAEVPDHPHARARDAFCEIDGTVQPAPATRFSRTPAPAPAPPPAAEVSAAEVLDGWVGRDTGGP